MFRDLNADYLSLYINYKNKKFDLCTAQSTQLLENLQLNTYATTDLHKFSALFHVAMLLLKHGAMERAAGCFQEIAKAGQLTDPLLFKFWFFSRLNLIYIYSTLHRPADARAIAERTHEQIHRTVMPERERERTLDILKRQQTCIVAN